MKPMYFLVNPRGRRRSKSVKRNAPKRATRRRQQTRARTLGAAITKTKRRPPHGFPSWAAWMASIRPNSPRSTTMSTKKKTRRRRRRNPPRAHAKRRRRVALARNPFTKHVRRRRRRNPPKLSPKAIAQSVGEAAIDATGVLAGKIITRGIRQKLPTSILDPVASPHKVMAVDAILSLALGIGAQFVSARAGKLLLTGGLLGVAESAAKSLNVAEINAALGDDFIPGMGGYIPGMGSYLPQLPPPAPVGHPLGSYVGGMGGADPEEILNYY